MKKTLKIIITSILALTLCLCIFGCGNQNSEPTVQTSLSNGGVLRLSVNPEIEIEYDADGIVTKVSALNNDAIKIISSYEGFEGKECRTVVSELVTVIGDAGYFIEEIEGEKRQITIEIEKGSSLPSETFLDDIASDVRNYVNSNNFTTPVDIEGESDYGMTDYVDTDYGPENDGVTDYDATDYGTTNYDDNNATNYGTTDYGKTNYDATDYGSTTSTTKAASNDSGYSNYDSTNYDDSNYSASTTTTKKKTTTTKKKTTTTKPKSNDSGYSDYDSNSNYGNSSYGDSGYDD